MTDANKKKVLLIKLSSLGDIIFNIPLANSLKKAGYSVSWLVGEKGLDIIQNNPCTDEVIFVPIEKWKGKNINRNESEGKSKNAKKNLNNFSFNEYLSILKKIRSSNFDLVIDAQGRWKSLIFTLFCNVKRRLVGSDSKELARFGGTEIVKIPSGWDINVIEKYLYFAKHLKIETNAEDMTLPPADNQAIEKVNILLKTISSDKPLLVLCPMTTWTTKHWDKDNWKELVNKLYDKFNLVFTGTNYDYIEYINEDKGLNLAGKTNLKELIEIFRRADLVISLDSGSTHLASAARAKAIISIFCSTPEKYYAPIGENYISLGGNLKCRPCHKRKCKNKTLACTKLPSTEDVLNAITKLTEKGIFYETKN